MIEIRWLQIVYSYICLEYLEEKSERTIKSLEYILFLIQYESLSKNIFHIGKPFISYKIYIDGISIRITYISDLLRTKKTILHLLRGRAGLYLFDAIFRNRKNIDKYENIFNAYKGLSEKTLEKKVQKVIEHEELNPKYYVLGKYENKFFRKLARFQANTNDKLIQPLVWAVSTALAIPLLIMPFIYIYLKTDSQYQHKIIDMSITTTVIYVICTIILTYTSIHMMLRWLKPTKYEIENHYDEE